MCLSSHLLGGLRELALLREEDNQRNEHGGHRNEEREVDTLVEGQDIVGAELRQVSAVVGGGKHRVCHRLGELLRHSAVSKILVAEGRHVRVVNKVVNLKPPLAQHGSHEGSNHATDVDEHVENLETAVALVLGLGQSSGTFLGGLGLEVVVHLTDESLQVAFEQTVTKSDEEQSRASEDEDAPPATRAVGDDAFSVLAEQRDSHTHITEGHDDQAPLDGAVVVLGAVGDDTANEAQHIDAEVEHRVDDTSGGIGQAELRHDEQQQDGVHDVVAETLTHVT